MRVKIIKSQGLRAKELTAFLLKFFQENNINSIDNFSMYFNSKDSRQLDISLKRKDYDMEERGAEDFDLVSF